MDAQRCHAICQLPSPLWGRDLKPAGTLRFSHYDQVVQAAMDGSGIAIGRNPHNARHLRAGLLVAPLGREAILSWGTYFIVIAQRSAQRQVVKDFSVWLREEIREDAGAGAERKVGTDWQGMPRPPVCAAADCGSKIVRKHKQINALGRSARRVSLA